MEAVNNLRDAMFQAGKLGHVEAVQGDDHVSYQVRKGFGNWLVHVVKWYSNKGYKERIIEQRTVVLRSLSLFCEPRNPREKQEQLSPFSDQRTKELSRHLEHGYRFQAQSMRILNTVYMPEVVTKNYPVAERLIGSHFRTDDAALKNLIIPGSKNNLHPHEGVDKEKFGAAYWKYAHTNTLGNDMYGVTENSERPKVNGGEALLEYALSKDENEKHQGTGLYQHKLVQRENDLGIDFEAWGIPDGIGEIELRVISGASCMQDAKRVVSIGTKGREALADDRKANETMMRGGPDPDMWKIQVRIFGKVAQLSELCEQFMRDEGIGEDSVPS